MATYHLHRWSVSGDAYQAPEIASKYLCGYRDQEEKPIRSSAITKIDGRTITTYSGSVYILEDIDPEYRQWLEDNEIAYDPENPIYFRKAE